MAGKKVKFAIVGYGHIGKRHAAMVIGNGSGEVVAVVEPLDDRRADANKEHGCPVFKSTKELFNAGLDIDVVNVCTPNGLHSDQAIEALSARCHVVIEKPMGLTRPKTEQVILIVLY